MPKKRRSFVEEAQTAKITLEDVKHLAAETMKRAEAGEYAGFEAQAFICFERFGKKGGDKSFALLERMRCMEKLRGDPRMKPWQLSDGASSFCFLRESVLAATAECPLQEREGSLSFDPEQFFRIALLKAETEREQ